MTTRSVEALRAYLDGEEASIAGRIGEAEAAFGRAVEADSGFWYAYFRLASATSWMEKDVDPAITKAYWDHRALLPRRERLLIEATDPDSTPSGAVPVWRRWWGSIRITCPAGSRWAITTSTSSRTSARPGPTPGGASSGWSP